MKHVLKPALSLFVIAAITTTLLSFVYTITLDPIESQFRRMQDNVLREIMPHASRYNELDIQAGGSITRIFEAYNNETLIGYVFELSPNGYSGRINIMAGILSEENVLTGIRILSHTETPGLGALAARESFYGQFNGKALNALSVVKLTNPREDEIQALTSATITTNAITQAVNEAIALYNSGALSGALR